jgi:linoleoyl-CoA desaturase
MKYIKFVAETETEHGFSITVRKRVNDYFRENGISTKGNLTLIIQTVVLLSMYLIPFFIILFVPLSGLVALLLTVVMGIGLAGVGMCVMHDAAHGSFSSKTWVNKLFAGSMYLLGGNVFNWKMQHNVFHHAYTNIEGLDEDIASRGPLRLSQNAPLKKVHKYQYIHAFFFYGLLTLSKLVKDFTQLAVYNKKGITEKYNVHPVREYMRMVALKLVYLFVMIGVPAMVTSFTWWQVVLGFLTMHWVAGFILSTIFQMAHVVEGTDQPMPDAAQHIYHDWAVHELLTTSNFGRDNRLLDLYVGGLNFQIEHHLFPNISHVHYRQISPIVEATAKEFNLEYNLKPSFRKALRSHVVRLKELGVQPPPALA